MGHKARNVQSSNVEVRNVVGAGADVRLRHRRTAQEAELAVRVAPPREGEGSRRRTIHVVPVPVHEFPTLAHW